MLRRDANMHMLHHGMHHAGPKIIIFPMGIIFATVASFWLTWKIAKSLETMAMVNALDEMGDGLSEAEKAKLESRIKHNLFEPCCCMGHCGRSM